MQTIRIRTPTVYRVTRAVPVHHTNARAMSFFPRFATGEFAPLFRLLDDYATHQVTRSSLPSFPITTLRAFQPRFDVREGKEVYELKGELPGIDQNDIAIEFNDAQTLSIRGHTERSEEHGRHPAAIEDTNHQASITQTDNNSSGYQRASVQDETTTTGATPDVASESAGQASPTSTEAGSEVVQQKPQKPDHKYWLSERSVGDFSRTFNFPARVDQENVRASLKDGILSIVVPKAQAPVSRRIAIE